ncbi:hypothetical protein VTL71DRAFT_8236 [Oculimacula yallundae]|uniref:Nicotinamide N-methyltransferase n=1 Tax=Oculimacula yallundae TaxID=86028 RepID=A0ABR4CXA5_9HELO
MPIPVPRNVAAAAAQQRHSLLCLYPWSHAHARIVMQPQSTTVPQNANLSQTRGKAVKIGRKRGTKNNLNKPRLTCHRIRYRHQQHLRPKYFLTKIPAESKSPKSNMLTDKIRLSGPELHEPEDYLSSSLAVIFPDDIINQHGDRESSVIYLSPSHGSLELMLADPEGEDSRKLFSHFLWNAGVQLAEFVEEGRTILGGNGEGERKEEWCVKGKRVLELGAGTGLAGVMAGLEGAERVVISDYPAPEVLKNISANVERNITTRRAKSPDTAAIAQVEVQGHEWGVLDDTFSVENKGSFDRILVADCLWMPWQHGNLLKSIEWFLKEGGGRAWVVAGFHTGRGKMRGFYEESVLKDAGLEIDRIWERNAEGIERDWVEDRGIEDVTERKRWLVIGVLKKRVG